MNVALYSNRLHRFREIVFSGLLLVSSWVSACPGALPSNEPGFCGSFKSVANCHCSATGLPAGMCSNMRLLYNRMISTFGTLERACGFQRDTSLQTCVEDWNCYWHGGVNSANQLCNGTGLACE